MEFSPLDVTQLPMQGGLSNAQLHKADSSTMLSQLSFESGLAERLTDFTDGWSVSSARSKLVSSSVEVGHRRLCHGVEAFEGAAAAAHGVLGHERDEAAAAGHVQQDNNSSSTSSEQTAAALHNRAGHTSGVKRKAGSTNSGKVVDISLFPEIRFPAHVEDGAFHHRRRSHVSLGATCAGVGRGRE